MFIASAEETFCGYAVVIGGSAGAQAAAEASEVSSIPVDGALWVPAATATAIAAAIGIGGAWKESA